jgi:cold shock CspA family protein
VQGVVKVYDPVTGHGIVVADDGTEVFLRPGALAGSIFRTLRQGQRIVFETASEDDRTYAASVRIGSDGY